MFDHVHGDWLDQRRYPWISLTQAAIYLISPGDDTRLAATNSHDWDRPFKYLREWIESGQIIVYEGWNMPFRPIPKEEFFGVPFKYSSHPEARQEEIRRAYRPGGNAFIECNLTRRPQEVVFDRYFENDKFEPRWRDLKIRSQELVGVLQAANLEAFAKLAEIAPVAEADDDQQTAKPGAKPQFNWDLIETRCHRLMDHHGDFYPNDPQWDCQARLEEAFGTSFVKTTGNVSPARAPCARSYPDGSQHGAARKPAKCNSFLKSTLSELSELEISTIPVDKI